METNKIQTTILHPFPGDPFPVKRHTEIGRLAKEFPNKVFGMANISPHIGKEEYIAEVRRCIESLGFIGMFLHAAAHGVFPISEEMETVFHTASVLSVPLMIYTGEATTALPSMSILKAREYPNVTVILAHAGWGDLADEHFLVAQKCSNVFLETSWCTTNALRYYSAHLPDSKLLFGSDMPYNSAVELSKYKALDIDDHKLHNYLCGNALKLFKLEIAT